MATNPRTAAFAALLVVCGLSHTTRAAPPAAAISSAAVTAQPQFAASVAMSPEDQATSDAFKRHGIPVPSARSTAELQKKLEASGALRAAVEKARAVADPQPAKRDAAITEIGKLAGNQAANIMEVLYVVMRDAIRETNADKRYYLEKLKTANQVAEEISKQLRDLAQASQRLADREKSDAGTSAPSPRSASREDLARQQRQLDAALEDARGKRDAAQVQFNAADQKANQAMQALVQVVKTMAELRSSPSKNMQ